MRYIYKYMSMLRLYDLAKPLMLALLLLVSVDVAAACGGEPNVELRGVSRVRCNKNSN
mgnify:CR=1 FL=1